MNSRVRIVKRSRLEVQRSEVGQKNATARNNRETAIIIKEWIAEHDERRRHKEAWHFDTLIKLRG